MPLSAVAPAANYLIERMSRSDSSLHFFPPNMAVGDARDSKREFLVAIESMPRLFDSHAVIRREIQHRVTKLRSLAYRHNNGLNHPWETLFSRQLTFLGHQLRALAAEKVCGDVRLLRPLSVVLEWSGKSPSRYTARGLKQRPRKLKHRGRGKTTYFSSLAGHLSRVKPVAGLGPSVRLRSLTAAAAGRCTSLKRVIRQKSGKASEAHHRVLPGSPRSAGNGGRYPRVRHVNHELAFEYLCTLAETRGRWSGVVRDLLNDIRRICRAGDRDQRHPSFPPERPPERMTQAATKRKRSAVGSREGHSS
jgi:hypothetical protein